MGHITGALYLDLKGAFDSVRHNPLLSKLFRYGIRDKEFRLFTNFLSSREQCVMINGVCSKFRKITRGVPQGSLLAPLLFSIFVNDLCDLDLGNNTKMCVYADDTALFYHDKSVNIVQSQLQSSLDKVLTWINNIGFPGQFRNFVDQIHFMSIQFRRFGSCTTQLSFDFIFPAFDFALTPIKSKFVSFKFAKNAASLQNGHSI